MELIVFDIAGTTIQDKNKVGLTLQETLREELQNHYHNNTIDDLSTKKK